MVMLQQSSWWGRHCIIDFCLLPLLAVPDAVELAAGPRLVAQVMTQVFGQNVQTRLLSVEFIILLLRFIALTKSRLPW